jgi:hypothetical protein
MPWHKFVQSSITSYILGLNILLSNLFSYTLNLQSEIPDYTSI